MPTIYLDFETRSKVNIMEAGAGRYAMDPSTKILMLAYAIDNGPIIGLHGASMPPEFVGFVKKGYIFCAQNAFFEYAVWKYKWGNPPRFKDTKAKLAAHGLPQKLELGARALQLRELKGIEGKRLINKYSIPRKDGLFNELDDIPEDKREFMIYCKQDVLVEREIDLLLPELTAFEQRLYELTLLINARGVRVDKNLARIAEAISTDLYERCNLRLKALTHDTFYSIKQTVRLKNYLNATYGLTLPDVSGDTLDEVLPTVTDPVAREIIELRSEYGRSSVSKFTRVLESVCPDDRVRDYLIYHGAHTGRWTSQIVQLHNLPKGGQFDPAVAIDIIKEGGAKLFETLYKYPISALSECIRGVLLPSEGKRLLVADYNAIEARVLMWMADQKDAVELFRLNQDIYVDMARFIYGDDTIIKKDFQMRQLGKQTILGAGFGMGPPKFKTTCAGYGIEIDDDLSKRAIYGYREKYKRVPAYWKDVEQAAMSAIRSGKAFRIGRVVFHIKSKFLYCRLPSGRDLAYYCPAIEERDTKIGRCDQIRYFTQNSQTKVFGKNFTDGGKLVENIVQAVARDLMADAKLRLEERGYTILLSSHDEIICEGDQVKTVKEMIEIMCDLPKWAEGCPITAEGWAGERYRK